MQTQLYEELKKTLSSGKIVYVFGSGISSALADTPLDWGKWLSEGINYILDKDLGRKLNKLIENNPATDDLIYIAGEVITETKKNNTYDTWMKNTIENLKIINRTLAKTLSLTRITGDIITTTNYDQLLETATGLDSITYEEPDKAFHMIDKGKANFVLHLHGLYDSENNIDNIVASKEQYDAIYNDEAAQFVQQFLGTRILVFIGAGQTTEDANISRFIKFAGEKLKIDRPYVYIKKSDYIVSELPENFIIIDYGDNYDDLPEFLYQMITYRISEFLSRNPIIGRTIFDTGSSDGYGLGGYHFAKESIPFSGRIEELSKLKIFAEVDQQILWWAITGQGGSGKSRLAYEFIKKIDKKYYSFFLRPTVTNEDLKSFTPFTDTFIVIDYIKGNERQISKIIKELIGKYKQSPYKLRLLMLERSNDTGTGSWYQNLLDNMNVYDRVEFEKHEYLVDTIFRKHNFLYLVDLEESAVEELIGNVCSQKGLPKDKGRDAKLREDYAKKFEQLKYRPLFLRIYVESWIDNGGRQVSYDSFESLLEASIQKEQERWLKATNNNMEATEALLSIVIRASIVDGMKIGDIPDIYKNNWDLVKTNFSVSTLPGIQRKRKINISIADTMDSLKIIEDFINPQYPDIIKEYMFLYYTDEEKMGKTGIELWENAAHQFGTFLGRCAMDFPDNTMLISTIKKATENTNNSHALRARLSLLQQETVRSSEDGTKMLGILTEEYEFWKNIKWDDYLSKESKEVILTGLYLCSVGFRGWQLLKESVEAIYDLISHAEDLSISEHCYNLIVNRMTVLTDEGGYTYSEKIFNKIKIVDEKPDRWRKLIKLKTLRNHTVNLYGMNKKDKAKELSEKVADYADWKDVDQLEVYADTLYSLAKLEYVDLQSGDLLSYSFELEDMMVYVFKNSHEYQVNDLIHYYYLHSKYLKVDRLSLVCGFFPENNICQYTLGLIDSLIEEIEENEMINEFSELYVGAWGLKVAYDVKVTDEEAENYIAKAFDYCNEYVDNAFLCEKTIALVSATYLEQYKRKPPIGIVDRCYSLLLRFPTSDDLITEFFDLVKQAEIPISQWHEKYVKKKSIVAGLFSNRRTDILYPEETESGPNTTYVRTHPKIGANQPCPCGSGKKFKKCCRGNGRYD